MGGIINIFASVSLSGAPFETVTVEEGMFILTQELVQGKGPCETITITTASTGSYCYVVSVSKSNHVLGFSFLTGISHSKIRAESIRYK